ncbi:MAG: hypothetical protein J6A94_09175 [Lachnospiraceae bacterium]|nr:hypothetical protein [Lachnospiraceae bacterium]
MVNTQEKTNTEAVLEKLQRGILINRIITLITCFCMMGILAGGFVAYRTVSGYVEQLEPVVEEISAVDFKAINDAVGMLEETVGAVDWIQIAAQLEQLDVDAINEAIAGLDTEELSEALENINEAAETLEKYSATLKSFTSKFGF